MNEVGTKLLLLGTAFLPEMHLRQIVFTYNAYEPFTKTRKG